MKNYLCKLDKGLLRIIRVISREADQMQLAVYIVGGIVRDILLSKKNLDLDISVEGNAIHLAGRLAKKWNARLITHKNFGTASLELPKGIRVDLAKARREDYVHPGALPTVQSGSLRDDLLRRDFTVNAMAIAINSNCFGQLIDTSEGLKDLSEKKIRILHRNSFMDDPTRILRAVRFEQRFNFKIERQTLFLIKAALKNRAVAKVKPPRYFAEFKKILCERDPVRPLRRLYLLGGFQFLDAKLKVRFQKLRRLHDHVQHVEKRKPYQYCNDWWLIIFMVLIAEANDRMVANILNKFHFTKNERTSIQQSRNIENTIKGLSTKQLRASEIYQILKPLTREVILYLRVQTSKKLVCRRIDRFLNNDIHVKLRINGNDLKKIGVTSGRKMGKILKNILFLKIDKQIHTKREELHQALQYHKY